VGVFALLNIWKPPGISSFDCIRHVRRCLARRTRLGHAGTLDPLAEGVLVVCLGPATRLVEVIQSYEKEYVALARLGAVSTTDDAEGEITHRPVESPPADAAVEEVVAGFVGCIEQIPPAHSAVKVHGRRAYALARSGRTTSLPARRVTVHAVEVLCYDYPHLRLRIRCGSGTYIRSLVRDIGQRLGVGGYVERLVRDRIGPFRGSTSVSLEQLRPETIRRWLLSPVEALPREARLPVTEDQAAELALGRAIPAPPEYPPQPAPAGAIDPRGRLAALVRLDPDRRHLRPYKVFRRS